jgi:Laminin B (Domain IV)
MKSKRFSQVGAQGATLILAATLIAIAAPHAKASSLATSTFDTGTDGWTDGDFSDTSTSGVSQDVAWNSTNKWITSDDPELGVTSAFVAPSKFTGNQSAAFNGTISFQLSDSNGSGGPNSGNNNQSALSLIGDGFTLYAKNFVGAPSSSSSSLTTYTITLNGSDFYTGNSGDQTDPTNGAVSDATLQLVLAHLSQVGIDLDWTNGADFATLDNVILTSGPVTATPLPAALPLFATGLAGFGLFARRKRKQAAA